MKKQNKSTLFIISGILFLIAALLADDVIYMYAGVGLGLITIGFSQKRKESSSEDIEEGELLTDEEEKQVWEKYKGNVEDDVDSTS